ncbi:unnamed protein product [Caenorhabditis bovis]|uniref:Protein transport protein sec16 n=1 Tax=Caenorhabditis bovis TaxID=2654633 RepID=A0A8S1EQ97_9PELO|nr:unnamed protein product [Caenorhabditis bovis]
MRYDRANLTGGSEMSDWAKSGVVSPPSSRYGEDDSSSTAARPRRSRLDNDIQTFAQPAWPSVSRKSIKSRPDLMNGRRSVGPIGSHNVSYNEYEAHSMSFNRPNPVRNGPGSVSGRFTPSFRYSSYAAEYFNGRNGAGGVALLPATMREPRRPRSTIAEKYTENIGRNAFGGYESASLSTSGDEKAHHRRRESDAESVVDVEDEEDDEEEEMRKYYLQAQRAKGSRSVTGVRGSSSFLDGEEAYYYGIVHLDLERVSYVMKTIPPPPGYFELQPIERVAYIFYCAVYKKSYPDIDKFHKRFNREFYKFVCAGDTDDQALFKICRSMQDQYTLRQLEASKRAYEQAQKEALETEKLDFNQQKGNGIEEQQTSFSQPEEVLSHGPLKFHTGHAFVTFGIGGKVVVVRPPGSVDPVNGATLTSTSIIVEDLKSMLHSDEATSKVLESVQNFKGPLIAGHTPTHSVRLYIQRQLDALKAVKLSHDVKKSDVADATLVWQLLEIMVQQHGRITGPDVAALLARASDELEERTGIVDNAINHDAKSRAAAKERCNAFLLGGHITEAIECAIADGLYADAMTLTRRLYPNDAKKIEEIEARFMQLRTIEDPFATLIAVASDQPPPILTNGLADDDENNWRRHAAIILANLSTPTAMQTIYHLGLTLAKKEKNCAADFCLLVVCLLAGYDPFMAVPHVDGEEKCRKNIGLIHSGSELLALSQSLKSCGTAGFSFVDLHATDIYDYALRLANNNVDSPLARSVDYQMARIAYAKKLASFGGFATDAFRYCTEVARSLWPYAANFDRFTLFDLCDLAEGLQYVAAASPAETEWIASLRAMLGDAPMSMHQQQEQQQPAQPELQPIAEQQPPVPRSSRNPSLSREAQQWHDEHQAPIEIAKHATTEFNPPPMPQATHDEVTRTTSSSESATLTASQVSASDASTIESYRTLPTPTSNQAPPPPPSLPPQSLPQVAPISPEPIAALASQPPPSSPPKPIQQNFEEQHVAKSPKSELLDLWSSTSIPPVIAAPQTTGQPSPTAPAPSVPNKTASPPMNNENERKVSKSSSMNFEKEPNRKGSRGWFGSIKEKVIKSIPSANQMILPDDTKPTIVWDPVKKRYVGEGVEEEVVAAPPPVLNSAPFGGMDSNKSSTNSLRSARSGGAGSRYLKVGAASTAPSTPDMGGGMAMMPPPPVMPLPASFSFMPTSTDDGEYVDPFSGESNPSIPSSENADAQNSNE